MANLEQLKKQQKAISSSINLDKKIIEDLTDNKQKFEKEIKELEEKAKKAKENSLFLDKEVEAKKQELKEVNVEFNNKRNGIIEINKAIAEKVKAEEKIENEKTKELDQKIKAKENELKKIEEDVISILAIQEKENKKSIELLSKVDSCKELIETNKKNLDLLEKEIKEKEDKNKELENNELVISKSIVGYENQVNELKEAREKLAKEITEFEEKKQLADKDLKKVEKDLEKKQEEFNVLSVNSKYLVDLKEYNKNQEEYLKEEFKKIGMTYEEFKQ